MRYTLVSLFLAVICFFFVYAQASADGFSNNQTTVQIPEKSKEKTTAIKGGQDMGNVSCEQAHALIRTKKNDRALREGVWQLKQAEQCPVLSREAYIALNQDQ